MFIPKKAFILAAGQGKRLLPYTKDKPKCLITFNDLSLIELQIASLKLFGINDIVVVVGYEKEKVKEKLRSSVRYIINNLYEETSSMYSLWLAKEEANDGFLLLNSDVLFHPVIMEKLLLCPSSNALAMDFNAILGEEEMKVVVNGKRVVSLSKALKEADGENVGMLKFDKEGSRILFEKIEELLELGYFKEMVPFAVNAIAPFCFIEAVSVDNLPWIEIDFPEDYEKAKREIFPEIEKFFVRSW